MIKPVWTRKDDLSSLVEIPIRARDIMTIRNILNLLGVPEVGRHGGAGFVIGEGAVTISGTQAACDKAVKNVLFHLNGPAFQSADVILEREKQGALP